MTTELKPLIDKNGIATHRHTKIPEAGAETRLANVPTLVPLAKPAIEDQWAEEREFALEILDEYGDGIVIGNHGAFPNRRPTVSLSDMADGDIARGNCWSIVNELIELNEFGSYSDELNIHTRDGLSHTGLYVQEDGKSYVVDYTARQFNPEFDFPFIASVPEWKLAIEKAYGKPFEFTPADNDEDDDDYDELG